MKKKLPKFKSDKEAADFLNQNLVDYLHSDNFKSVSFEYAPKNKTISLRLSEGLFEAIKSLSSKQGIPYQRFIRIALEQSVTRLPTKSRTT